MPDTSQLLTELKDYLGDNPRILDLDDRYGRLQVKLYAAEKVPKVGFKVDGNALVPVRDIQELTALSALALCGCDLIAELDDDKDCFGALMWFPSLNEFGTWLGARSAVLLYPAIEFSDVLRHPIDYIYARGLSQNHVQPYSYVPWVQQSIDEERYQALMGRVSALMGDATRLPEALKAALVATDRRRLVSERYLQAADYRANQLIRALRDSDAVVATCDNLLQSLTLTPQFACALINEAARFECNSGNDAAAITRLELAIREPVYGEYHERFRKILDHIRNLPPK